MINCSYFIKICITLILSISFKIYFTLFLFHLLSQKHEVFWNHSGHKQKFGLCMQWLTGVFGNSLVLRRGNFTLWILANYPSWRQLIIGIYKHTEKYGIKIPLRRSDGTSWVIFSNVSTHSIVSFCLFWCLVIEMDFCRLGKYVAEHDWTFLFL